MMGALYIVATPIGNLEDISIRALRTLFSVDVIACEDTRRTGLLLSELKKRYPSVLPSNATTPDLVSYYDETEYKRAPELLELLSKGNAVALVSDAGTPLISDPGFVLVTEALKRGIAVRSIPGPTAEISALSISGLSANPVLFLGFPPEKAAHRVKLLETIRSISGLLPTTFIFYSAPHKLEAFLNDMNEVLGEREIVICRELTKQFEETWRGSITEALSDISRFKGELVILLRIP